MKETDINIYFNFLVKLKPWLVLHSQNGYFTLQGNKHDIEQLLMALLSMDN